MARLRFRVSDIAREFEQAMADKYQPIAEAGTAAMTEMANRLKLAGRADIASAGFSKRWQNAFRVDVYPKRRASADAAALVYHRIPYADVFETGATIRGKPTLWVPLPVLPKRIGRERMSPKLYEQRVGPLQFIKGSSGVPLLVGRIAGPKGSKVRTVTLASARRGARGEGNVQTVPLFVGVDAVTLRDRFSLRQITDKAAALLPALYRRAFRDR
jgi:hypothetical protein